MSPPLIPFGAEGVQVFSNLWDHFMAHKLLSDWLMCYDAGEVPLAKDVGNGVAFCCGFPVPARWQNVRSSFGLGEMMVPVRSYGRFLCGVLVAATSVHKYAACLADGALGDGSAGAFRTVSRRIVCDLGGAPGDAVNLIDFAWMEDGSLIVSTKVLSESRADEIASCPGAFAIYRDERRGGRIPRHPAFVVSYTEVPHCTHCTARGFMSGCICRSSAFGFTSVVKAPPPSEVRPGHLVAAPIERPRDTLHNRLSAINTSVSVRVNVQRGEWAVAQQKYVLRPLGNQTQFVVNFAMPSNYHLAALRQVAALGTSFGPPTSTVSGLLSQYAHEGEKYVQDSIYAPVEEGWLEKSDIHVKLPVELNTDIQVKVLSDLISPEGSHSGRKVEDEYEAPPPPAAAVVYELPTSSGVKVEEGFGYGYSQAFAPNPTPTGMLDMHIPPHPVTMPQASTAFPVAVPTEGLATEHFFPYGGGDGTPYDPTPSVFRSAPEAEALSKSAPDTSTSFLDMGGPVAETPYTSVASSPVTPINECEPVGDPAPGVVGEAVDRHPPAKRVRHASATGVRGECGKCGKYFFKSGALLRHMKTVHPGVGFVRAAVCGAASAGGRPAPSARLQCSICTKTFSQQGSLNRHMNSIHLLLKLHCKYCNQAFGQLFDLTRHHKRKHPGFPLVVPAKTLPRRKQTGPSRTAQRLFESVPRVFNGVRQGV